MTTFCWLPPLSELISACGPAVLTCTSLISLSIRAFSRAREIRDRLTIVSRLASDMLAPTLMSWTRPSRCRSSGTRPIPMAIRSWMVWPLRSFVPSRARPAAIGSRPDNASISSVRPAPIRP